MRTVVFVPVRTLADPEISPSFMSLKRSRGQQVNHSHLCMWDSPQAHETGQGTGHRCLLCFVCTLPLAIPFWQGSGGCLLCGYCLQAAGAISNTACAAVELPELEGKNDLSPKLTFQAAPSVLAYSNAV